MRKVTIGIDPGKKGAIAYFVDGELKEVKDIPLIKTEIDVAALTQLLSDHISLICPGPTSIFMALENVHALFGASAGSTFTFGHICGLLEGIICAYKYQYVKVQPKEWQKVAWAGVPNITRQGKKTIDSKAMSRVALTRLFPTKAMEIPKSKDGQVDAILIGYWANGR